jgi:hypothetical protein
MWLKFLAGWGPLGLWSAAAEWRARKATKALADAEKDHHGTRDDHEGALAKLNAKHAAEIARVEEAKAKREAEHASEIRGLVDDHQTQVRELIDEAQKQVRDVTDRMVKLVERQSAKTFELADKIERMRDDRPAAPKGG